jgi:hypothetical protein
MMNLTITRKPKHVFETAYSGVRLRPGASVITEPAAIAALLDDKRFQNDRASGLFTVVETDIPDAETLATMKGPSITEALLPDSANMQLGPFPDVLASNAVIEAKALAEGNEKVAVEFAGACTNPHVLFSLYQQDKRKKVRAAVSAMLNKVYERDVTEAEILAVGNPQE